MKFYELVEYAEDSGLFVASRSIGRHHGRYLHSKNLILLSPRLTGPQTLSILAHELGHWFYGDADPEGIHSPDVEARAWRWGARHLVSSADYAEAERAVGPHHGAIARYLGVTRQLVDAWQPPAVDARMTWRTA
ncbi:ImmA/IrrE family metallo-endopeptidase [Cellulosimicrobium funkei]|uniref:ImmA/IrrE family metallo-endopeptidase n=1 Tax=Cellulosimicrobium funkei TaxID=264251 RepID=UPI0037DD898C